MSPLDKMDAILQRIYSYFSIVMNKTCRISIIFSSKFVPKGRTDNNPRIVLDKGLAPNWRQTIIWTSTHPIRWRIYAALGGDRLNRPSLSALENQ